MVASGYYFGIWIRFFVQYQKFEFVCYFFLCLFFPEGANLVLNSYVASLWPFDVGLANDMYCNLLFVFCECLGEENEENRMMQIWVCNRAIF